MRGQFLTGDGDEDNFHLGYRHPIAEGEVVTVCMVTATKKTERLVSLEPGDHPFIKHKSAISYGFSKIRMVADIEPLLRTVRPGKGTNACGCTTPNPSRLVTHTPTEYGPFTARSWVIFRRIIE